MPAPDTSVKTFHSSMVGAPTLSGTAGALIAVLDACLVNGFGAGAVDSIVVAGGIATATRGAGHPAEVGTVMEISGAVPAGLNGPKRVLTVSGSNIYTFDATGIADQTATGSITHKVAAAGWEKAFSGTDLAAYRSFDVTGTRLYLRVNDTDFALARVVGYESMSGINTGVAPFPLESQLSGGTFVRKSNLGSVSAAARGWVVIADSRGFYLMADFATGINTGLVQVAFFGDIKSNRSPDPYGCIVASTNVSTNTNPGSMPGDLSFISITSDQPAYLARGSSQLGGSVFTRRTASTPAGVTNANSGATNAFFMQFPNPADNGLYVTPLLITEPYGAISYRGVYPGAYYVPQAIGGGVFATRSIVEGSVSLPDRKLMAAVNTGGVMFIDVTGPWR